jgi:hypothetical protein
MKDITFMPQKILVEKLLRVARLVGIDLASAEGNDWLSGRCASPGWLETRSYELE